MEKDLMLIIVIALVVIFLVLAVSHIIPALLKPQPINKDLEVQSKGNRSKTKRIIEDSQTQYKAFMDKKSEMPKIP